MKKFLALLCIAAFTLCAADRLLYESRVDRAPEADWKLTEGDVTMEQAPWPDAVSGLTVKLTYHTHPTGWPSGKFYLPEGLRDWRGAKMLRIDYYVQTPGIYGFCVATYPDKTYWNGNGNHYAPGRYTIRIDLNELKDFDLSDVKYIDCYTHLPEEDRTVYIGDIVLEMGDPEAEAAARKSRAEDLKAALAWRLALLGRNPKSSPGLREVQAFAKRVSGDPGVERLERFEKLCGREFPKIDRQIFLANGIADGTLAALWCAPEEKVLRDSYAFRNAVSRTYELSAARGEGESAQLVVFAKQSQKGVRVEFVSAPKLDGGSAVIPLDALSIAPMGYLKSNKPCYPVDYIGYWPDPILEYLQTPIPVEENTFQTWWLDAQVPENQQPGIYRGEVKISSDGGDALLSYTIHVRNFTLPKGSAYLSVTDFNLMPTFPADPAAHKEYWRKTAKMLLKHRMDPFEIYHGFNRKDFVEDSKWLLDQGARAINIGFLNREMDDAYEAEIAKAYRACVDSGFVDKAVIYGYDECGPEKFEMIRNSLVRARKAAPGIPIYTTIYDRTFGTHSGMTDLIDVWIPLTKVYGGATEDAEKARAKGHQVGWYVCCSPLSPYANFLLEYPATGTRLLMGFMNRKYKPDCFLYYYSTMWQKHTYNPDTVKWTEDWLTQPISGGPLIDTDGWKTESFHDFSGDGRLLYPAPDAPIPTQRLKNIRDGEDDWLYMDLLEKALADSDRMPTAWKAAAKEALEVEPELVESLTAWTTDYMRLQQKREKIAQLLEQYHR